MSIDVFIPNRDIVSLYIVYPWDEPGTAYHFNDYILAVQYATENFGSRYDLMEDNL